MPGSSQADDDWRSLLLSKDPCHIRHTFEDESPGMPWARAKFQVRPLAAADAAADAADALVLLQLPCMHGGS